MITVTKAIMNNSGAEIAINRVFVRLDVFIHSLLFSEGILSYLRFQR